MSKRKASMSELAKELISAPSTQPTLNNRNPDEGYGDSSSDEDDDDEEEVDNNDPEEFDSERETKRQKVNHMAIITAMNSVATLTDLVNGIEQFYSQVKLVSSQISNLTVLHVRSKIADSVWANLQYRSRFNANSSLDLNVLDNELEDIPFESFLDFLKQLSNDFKSGGGKGLDDQLLQLKISNYFSLEPSEMQKLAGELAHRLFQLKQLGEQSKTSDAELRICKSISKKLKDFSHNAGGKLHLLNYAKSFYITFEKVRPLQKDNKVHKADFELLLQKRNELANQQFPTKVDDLIHRIMTAHEFGRKKLKRQKIISVLIYLKLSIIKMIIDQLIQSKRILNRFQRYQRRQLLSRKMQTKNQPRKFIVMVVVIKTIFGLIVG